jgi:transposase-like protein
MCSLSQEPVPWKDRKNVAADLREIYTAKSEADAEQGIYTTNAIESYRLRSNASVQRGQVSVQRGQVSVQRGPAFASSSPW